MADETGINESAAAEHHGFDEVLAEYLRATEAGQPPDREKLLSQHPELAGELREFFGNHDRMEQLARRFCPLTENRQSSTPPEKIRYFGDYEIVEEIGRGGMGVIYKARQTSLNRIVALKMLGGSRLDSALDVQRFQIEAEAVAGLDHPHIVPIYEVGSHDGRHYFSMKLIEGGNLSERVAAGPLPSCQAARLMVLVARAVHYAHQRGILHRDLKPANILIDSTGQPVVTDFGLAKRFEQENDLTQTGAVLGTPSYMAPEQALGQSRNLTTATDVYGLGAVLYAVLTGRPPFVGENSLDILAQVRECDPARLGGLNGRVDRDLEIVCLKCLEKEPSRRFQTAGELADDLERYLADEPVLAAPPSWRYRLRKSIRRHKAALITVGLVATALVMGTVVSTWQAVRATHAEWEMGEQRDAAARAGEEAKLAEADAKKSEKEAQRQQVIAVENEQAAKTQELLARRRYYAAQMNLAVQAWEQGDTPRVLQLLDTQRPRIGEEDLRAFEWYALWQLCHQQLRFSRQVIAGPLSELLHSYGLAFSPDSKMLALAAGDGTVQLLDATNGRPIRTLDSGSDDGPVASSDGLVLRGRALLVDRASRGGPVAFSPDGKRLAHAAGRTANEVTLWDVNSGKPAFVLKECVHANGLAFSPDGKTLATGSGGSLKLWDAATGALKQSWNASSGLALTFSPDGNWLATTVWSNTSGTHIWDVTVTPPILVRKLAPGGTTVAFSADSKHIAIGTSVAFSLFDTATWKQVDVKDGNRWGRGHSLAFIPDTNTVAVGVDARSVKLVDVRTGKATTLPHHAPVHSLAMAPDGKAVAAIGSDRVLKVWNLGPADPPDVLDVGGGIASLTFSPNGQTLAVGLVQKRVKLLDVTTGTLQGDYQGHRLAVKALAFFRDGKRLASGSASWEQPGELKIWDLVTSKELVEPLEFKEASMAIAVAPDDRTLAVGGPYTGLALFDVATGQRRALREAPHLTALTYSPDGTLLISAGAGGKLALRDPVTGAEQLTFGVSGGEAVTHFWSLSCSPDGKLLASGNGFGVIHLWELPSGRLLSTLRGDTVAIYSVAFFPDGKTLASANAAEEVKLWDVVTGQERITFRLGHRLAISPDGKMLAAGTAGKVRLLRAPNAPESITTIPTVGRLNQTLSSRSPP